MTNTIITVGGFDSVCSRTIRFLHEASKRGPLEVLLPDDGLFKQVTGSVPRFPLAERLYFLENIRYVRRVHPITRLAQLEQITTLLSDAVDGWVSCEDETLSVAEQFAQRQGIPYCRFEAASLAGFPEHGYDRCASSAPKVIVTGCFDWFHTGHVRFFEEAAEYGDLYVIVGHDRNIEAMKGPGHPMFPQQERNYVVGAIRFVKQALISSGDGWLDAEPEIRALRPDLYIVNEDGDKPIKREYCEQNGIEYIVLKREPKPGLTPRTSTNLRGF